MFNVFALLLDQASREPRRSPGIHNRVAPKHFHGTSLGRKFLNFCFQNGTIWRTLYFWLTAEPPNVAGLWVANPLPHPLDGLVLDDALKPATPLTPRLGQRNAACWCFYKTQGSVATHLRCGRIFSESYYEFSPAFDSKRIFKIG